MRSENTGCRSGAHQSPAIGRKIILLGGVLALMLSFPVYAMPPYDNIPEGVTEEQYRRMQDNLVEWDELSDLVQYYNPMYTQYHDSAMGTVDEARNAYGQFVMDAREQIDAVDVTIDSIIGMQETLLNMGVPESANSFQQLKQAEAEARAGRAQLKNTVGTTQRTLERTPKSVEIKLYPIKKQLVSTLEGLMISHAQLSVNASMVEKQVTLYETLYQTQQNLRAQNMATDAEVQAALNSLNTAKTSLSQVKSGLDQLGKAIGMQLGWSAEGMPKIGAVPEPDLGFVDTTDPAADKEEAMMNSAEVREAGKAANGSSYAYTLRDMTENEAKGKLSAKMDSLYADMKEKKALYEAANTTLERARLTKEAAERQYRLGMLGRGEYEAQELAYISYEAAAALAKLNLVQAINTYQWAVKGVLATE